MSDDFRETLDHYLETSVDDEHDDIDWLYEDLKLGDLTELGAFANVLPLLIKRQF